MKILVAILSCHARTERCEAQRKTWIQSLSGLDHRFFFGRGSHSELKPDEVQVDVADDYGSIFLKSLKIFAWAFEHGYDFVLKCDDDAMLDPKKLSELTGNDYIGEVQANGATDFCSGGCYGV